LDEGRTCGVWCGVMYCSVVCDVVWCGVVVEIVWGVVCERQVKRGLVWEKLRDD
jgi:hypothetical protein